jgi:hypothetical protein
MLSKKEWFYMENEIVEYNEFTEDNGKGVEE